MKAILQLGRYGDIINILPVAYDMAQKRGIPTPFIVAEEFHSILQGTSYTKPLVWNGDWKAVEAARIHFTSLGYDVLVSQVWGQGWAPVRKTPCFLTDSYARLDRLDDFGKLPLIFDRRDKDVEVRLPDADILINFSGYSCPFNGGGKLLHSIKETWGQFKNVVDLGDIRSTHLYDLLGMFERAKLLLTIDTSTLHLSRAVDIPTIQLTRPASWEATPPWESSVLTLHYDQAVREATQIHAAIAKHVL